MPGQTVANKVDVRLVHGSGETSTFYMRNEFGQVHVIVDVYGYFEPIAAAPEPERPRLLLSNGEANVDSTEVTVTSILIPADRVALISTVEDKTTSAGTVSCRLYVDADEIANDNLATAIFSSSTSLHFGLTSTRTTKTGFVVAPPSQARSVSVRCRAAGQIDAHGTASVRIAAVLF